MPAVFTNRSPRRSGANEPILMKALLVLSVLSLPWIALPGRAESPAVDGAEVTIPYLELRALLDAAEKGSQSKPEPVPPVDASLGAAKYRLDFSNGEPSLTARFEVVTFTDDWHSVALFGGAARLESAQATEGAASVIRRDEDYALLAKGTGRFDAELSLALPDLAEWEKGDGLVLAPAPASVGELRVTGLPADKAIRIDGVKATRTPAGEWVFPLPRKGSEWKIALEEASTESTSEVVPSAWSLHSQILLRYTDGRLRHSARLQTRAETGSGLSLSLALPANATGVSVEGEDIANWKIEPGEAERSLRITWETRDLLDRTLLLNWEIPQSPLADTWEVAPPRVRHAEATEDAAPPAESRALVAVVAVDGLELTHPSLRKGLESLRLPDWLGEQLGEDEALTAEIVGDAPVSIAARWLPRLQTAQATVSLATFETRLVSDGSTLVTADYRVQHAAPITWKLELPSADEILACSVNGKDTSPIRRSENEIEFHLPSPPAVGEEGPSSTVRLSYSRKTEALDPVSGRVALELPLTGLFIHRLSWALSIPDGYEPTAVEGNVQIAPGPQEASPATNLIHLGRELCHGERPAVEIHYQRSAVTTD